MGTQQPHIEHKHKNTGTSVLIHLQNFEKQSVKPSFRLFVQI